VSESKSVRVARALAACPLYFILDESLTESRSPKQVALAAITAGVRMLQLRFKSLSTREYTRIAAAVVAGAAGHDCIVIVNDRVDIALISGAHGVHVGAEDPAPAEIARVAGKLIIGATARTARQALAASEAGADYIGCGSVYASQTKQGLPVIGTAGLVRVVAAVKVPVTAIGGINALNCGGVMATGAAGFTAVKPFVCSAVGATVKQLVAAAAAS
jgi:thiamine-phosphate diphosphorylase